MHGLTSSAHLNNSDGILLDYNKEIGRWAVSLDAGETKIRPQNLKPSVRWKDAAAGGTLEKGGPLAREASTQTALSHYAARRTYVSYN